MSHPRNASDIRCGAGARVVCACATILQTRRAGEWKRSPLVSIAIFGAGVAVGAGAGADMRRTLLGGAKDLKHKAPHTIERAESEGTPSTRT